MKLVINIPEEDYEMIKNTTFTENTETIFRQSSEDRKLTMMLFRLLDSVTDGKPLQEDATNGDIIKAMFPNVEVKEKNNGYEVYFGIGTCIQFFNYKWWNSPYKRG